MVIEPGKSPDPPKDRVIHPSDTAREAVSALLPEVKVSGCFTVQRKGETADNAGTTAQSHH